LTVFWIFLLNFAYTNGNIRLGLQFIRQTF